MFPVSDHDHSMSLKLVSVLEEVGVNEHSVQKRRRTMLLYETLSNLTHRMTGKNISAHIFGSQVEGTTTMGLHSDTDLLWCENSFNVIQDYSEWEPGQFNLLLIQDENTSPGYCMLQCLSYDAPLPQNEIPDANFVKYRGDKILMKNTAYNRTDFEGVKKGDGPAITFTEHKIYEHDYVPAFPIKSMPPFLKAWLDRQFLKGRLSQEMKTYIETHPCYVVPKGSKGSPFEEVEWRISTSHVERCLMFSLNITQTQCYVTLKLILKTHLTPPSGKFLSTFMLKNILLLSIEEYPDIWYPHNLLTVFTICLLKLKDCISQEHCPHFIMHENNLMARRFTAEIKHWLLESIQNVLEVNIKAFTCVQIDEIGSRLQNRLDNLHQMNRQSNDISTNLVPILSNHVQTCFLNCLEAIVSGSTTVNNIIMALIELKLHGNKLEQAASRLLSPLICSSLGSVLASMDIQLGQTVSAKALEFLSLGLNSNLTTSRLKLASVYYCASDVNKAEDVLKITDEKYKLSCCCCDFYLEFDNLFGKLRTLANISNEEVVRLHAMFSVVFSPNEVHCQPQELQYEMFRYTQDELAIVTNVSDFRNDWVMVDSLPYLYFLQYKTYQHLNRNRDKLLALINLAWSINITPNLEHKETALNLLGQCMEQENRHRQALCCYIMSLNIKPRKNAARIHICILLNKINVLCQLIKILPQVHAVTENTCSH